MKKKRDGDLGSAAVLACANIVCRILGFMFKVPLTNLIGSEGMGYFGLATQVFGVATFPSTGGLPTVLGRETAFRDAKGEPTLPFLKTLTPIFLAIGASAALVMGLFSKPICALLGTLAAVPSVAVLAPAVFFVSAEAMYRSYLQGRSMLFPGALAQTCEAAAKLAVGTGMAYFLFKRGYPSSVVAAGAAFGVTAGTAVAAGVLRIRIFSEGRIRACSSEKGAGKKAAAEAFPITLASGIMSLIGALDAAVILNRLSAIGNSSGSAASLYGIYTGYAVTVYALPFALTGAVSSWVSPIVSGAFATGNGKMLADGLGKALAISAGIGFFAGTCYVLMPGELLGVFFSRSEVSLAAPLLALLAPSVVLAPMLSVFSGALSAMGKIKPAVVGSIVSGVIKLGLNFFLVGRADLGILGAPISAGISFLIGLIITGAGVSFNIREMGVKTGFAGCLAAPLVLGTGCGYIAFRLCGVFSVYAGERIGTVMGVCAGGLIFAAVTAVSGGWGLRRKNSGDDK